MQLNIEAGETITTDREASVVEVLNQTTGEFVRQYPLDLLFLRGLTVADKATLLKERGYTVRVVRERTIVVGRVIRTEVPV
jgi:hypothetical protein